MTTRGIIFDLDNTLIDTRISEKYRDRRQWDRVFQLVQEEYRIDPEMLAIVNWFRNRDVKICVVSNSLLDYCNHALRVVGLSVDYVIGYEDTVSHKPEPEPIFMAKALMGQPDIVVGVGDEQRDMKAYQQTGVQPVLFTKYSARNMNLPGICVCKDLHMLGKTIQKLLSEDNHVFR